MSANPKLEDPGLSHGDNLDPSDLLLQAMDARMTGEFKFEQGRFAGSIFMKQGEPWHAWCNGTEGEAAGDAAICEVLKWHDGTCAFVDGVLASVRSTHLPWSHILRSDDAKASLLQPRSGMRFDPTAHVPRFRIHEASGADKVHELTGARLTVGSAPDNDIVLEDPAVFTQHCEFVLQNGEVRVRDLFTTTGTYVNTQRVTESPLQIGDVIRIGEVVIQFDVGVKRPGSVQQAPAPAPPVRGKAPGVGPIAYKAVPNRSANALVLAVMAISLLAIAAAVWYFVLANR
jgi:hypothetical protein